MLSIKEVHLYEFWFIDSNQNGQILRMHGCALSKVRFQIRNIICYMSGSMTVCSTTIIRNICWETLLSHIVH